MASDSTAMDLHRPAMGERTHSGLENILPTSIVKSNPSKLRSRPPPTPLLARSISSMTDSFVLDHRALSRSPPGEVDSTKTIEQASTEEDVLTPISNWAHLSYMKNQRNNLLAEVTAHQLAGAKVKRSVSSLRRLAFRMAVNISVKDKHIATSARNLANSRKGHYLQGKDAEQRIEGLRRALSVEECRNKKILETLERASMLTLEYSIPQPRVRPHTQLFSPPPSPLARSSNLLDGSLVTPTTPLRPATWREFELELTPTINTPSEVCSSDSRLIRAQQESAQALTACRNRIEELQNECKVNKEDVDLLAATRHGLEQEIHGHQLRVASLQRSRASVESTLDLTRSQLQLVVESGLKLEQQLHTRDTQFADLEHKLNDKQQVIDMLLSDNEMLEERLKSRNIKFRRLEVCTNALTLTLQSLQSQLKIAEQHESILRDRLAGKESAREDLSRRLERGSQHIELLQKMVKDHETESIDHVRQAKNNETNISALRKQLNEAQHNNTNNSKALATTKTEVVLLQASWQEACQARDAMRTELESARTAKSSFQEELCDVRKDLEKETAAKDRFRTELITLCTSHDVLEDNLQAAQARSESLEEADRKTQSKIEMLRDGKAALEADLVDARQILFRLREELRMTTSELAEVESAKSQLQQRLSRSEERTAALEKDIEKNRAAAVESDKRHKSDFQKSNAQLGLLEDSVLGLQTALASSEEIKRSVEEELHQAQTCKDLRDRQLSEARRTLAELKIELEQTWSNFVSTEHDRAKLQVKVDELANEVEASLQTKAHLEDRLASSSNENNTLDRLVLELEAALRAKCDEKVEADNALAIAQKLGMSTEAELAGLRGQLSIMEAAKGGADSRLRDALCLQEDLENNYNSASTRLAAVKAEVANVRSQLIATQEGTVELRRAKSETEERLDAIQGSYTTLQSKTKLLEARLPVVELSVENLSSALVLAEEELGALHRDKVATEKQMAKFLETNTSLEREFKSTHRIKAGIESELKNALDSSVQLETKLEVVTSRVDNVNAENAHLTSKLGQTVDELADLQQQRDSIEQRLDAALATIRTLEEDLSSSRFQVEDAEKQNASLVTKLSEAKKELFDIKEEQAHLQDKLIQSKNNNLVATDKITYINSRLAEAISSQEILASRLSMSEESCQRSQKVHVKLEEDLRGALRSAEDLTSDLHVAQKHLGIVQQEGLEARDDLQKAQKEIEDLRESNVRLAASEMALSSRLGLAEKNLSAVRKTNTRLEALIARVEINMRTAEAVVTESETCLEKFVAESQANIDAVRLDKLEYKRRLSSRNSELEILLDENSRLHKKVHEQIHELGNFKEARERLVQDLADKETYIAELGSSSERRLKSMHSAYDELRKKHEHLQITSQASSARERSSDHPGSATSIAELEQKLCELEEDKRAFEKLVTKLKEKTSGLEILKEWQEVSEVVETASPRHTANFGDSGDSKRPVASKSPTAHMTSSRPSSGSRLSTTLGQQSLPSQRPNTCTSNNSHDEEPNVWANEIKRLRSLRDATANELNGLKMSKYDLKKILKDTETQLQRLEKQQTPRGHRSVLRKSRPSTPFHMLAARDHTLSPSPQTPSRPATSSSVPFRSYPLDTTHHRTGLESPGSTEHTNTSSTHTEHRRWPMMSRPMTSHRPETSPRVKYSLKERPVSIEGEFILDQTKNKRRWSSGLRSLFSSYS